MVEESAKVKPKKAYIVINIKHVMKWNVQGDQSEGRGRDERRQSPAQGGLTLRKNIKCIF